MGKSIATAGHGVSHAQASRLASVEGQLDFFGIELTKSQRARATAREGGAERYECMKGGVRLRADDPEQYERGIKAGLELIKY